MWQLEIETKKEYQIFSNKNRFVLISVTTIPSAMADVESRLSPQEEKDLNKFQKFFAFKVDIYLMCCFFDNFYDVPMNWRHLSLMIKSLLITMII